MDVFRLGPDGLLLVQALIVSIVVAALAWRRVAFSTAAILTALVAVGCAAWLALSPDTTRPVLVGLFVLVPSALLLGASRVRWIAHHAWVLALAGPIVFAGCYVGICEFCVKANLI